MPPLHTILLLCALAAPVFSATLFVIFGSVHCSLPKQWQFAMRVVEDDKPLEDDILFTSEVQSPMENYFSYNVSAVDTHDGVTNDYEIKIEVLHNCNDRVYTKNARTNFMLGAYPVNHGTHYIKYDMDLTNRGTPHKYSLTNWEPSYD